MEADRIPCCGVGILSGQVENLLFLPIVWKGYKYSEKRSESRQVRRKYICVELLGIQVTDLLSLWL